MKNMIDSMLTEKGIQFQRIDEEDRAIYRAAFCLENGKVEIVIDVQDLTNKILMFAMCPINAPQAKRAAIADFITRANFGHYLGCFEMDFQDGDIRYKCCLSFREINPDTEDIFFEHLSVIMSMMDRYLPGIMAIIYGTITPADAISQIENSTYASRN